RDLPGVSCQVYSPVAGAAPRATNARPNAATAATQDPLRIAAPPLRMMTGSESIAFDKLIRIAVERPARRWFPERRLLNPPGQREIAVSDPAGGVRLESHPDFAPGDGQVGVVPGGLGVVADQVDEHERRLPTGG